MEGSKAKIKLTFTCMGCPAMDMIQDDVSDRLLEMDGIDEVDIEVVWRPGRGKILRRLGGSNSRRGGRLMRPVENYEVFTARVGEAPLRHNGNVRAAEPRDAAVYAHLMYDEWRWREMFVVPSQAIVRVIRPE